MAAAYLLSVVVPVFNEAPTVRRSLERILKAELPLATEIIVVDDGSTDDGIVGPGSEPPYLIDPQMLGLMYLDPLAFADDPYSEVQKELG